MKSILSYPKRGHYGNNNYRGNCTGYLIKDLIRHFQPKTFVDACEGSGTSKEVCHELDIKYFGLDLHQGFDFTQHSILEAVGQHADIVFTHPPYFNMINYTEERKKHHLTEPNNCNDTSLCRSVNEFNEKSQVMLYNQREATRPGHIYTTLIGDYRKNGSFYSFQSDFINMMPKNELISVAIKIQHNHNSSFNKYNHKNYIPIEHEYLIIWKKAEQSIYEVIWDQAKSIKNMINASWRTLVRIALMNLSSEAPLNLIYSEIEKIASQKIANNPNYKAKIRQTLQFHFTHVKRGVWAI